MNEKDLLLKGAKTPIVKRRNQSGAPALFGRILKNQVLDAEENARQIVRRANERANGMIEDAEAEAGTIRHDAYESGRAESMQELLEDILAAREQRSEALFEIERDVLKLSVKIAEKIIGSEIKQDETVRAEIVLTALRQARQQEMLTVRVNAEDLPLIEKMRARIDAFGRARYLDFVADQTVGAGGCLIESASGTIDARLETQLRVFERALLAQVLTEPENE